MSDGTEKRFADIGARIRAAREVAGLSGKALALKLGYSHGAVNQWENGRQTPKVEALIPLCAVLKVSTDHVLLGAPREGREEEACEGRTEDLAMEVLLDAISQLPDTQEGTRVKIAATLLRRVKGER